MHSSIFIYAFSNFYINIIFIDVAIISRLQRQINIKYGETSFSAFINNDRGLKKSILQEYFSSKSTVKL